MNTPVTEKTFTMSVKEIVYVFSLILALVGQWYSHKAALNEAILQWKGENALLRLEVQVLKAQIEKLETKK